MTESDTIEMLDILAAAYPREVTDQMVTLWHNVFDSTPLPQFAKAVADWIDHESFFPTPADIRRLMRQAASRIPEPAALPTGSTVTGPEGGFAIAYAAYCKEVEKQGRQPKSFEQFMGQMPPTLRYSGSRR